MTGGFTLGTMRFSPSPHPADQPRTLSLAGLALRATCAATAAGALVATSTITNIALTPAVATNQEQPTDSPQALDQQGQTDQDEQEEVQFSVTSGTFDEELVNPTEQSYEQAPSEVAQLDEQTLDTNSEGPGRQPYQIYQVDNARAGQIITVTAVVDPSRKVQLMVWDQQAGEWELAADEQGQAPENTELNALLRAQAFNDQGQAYVAVVGEDPHMTGSTEWNPTDAPALGGFRDPSTYDFSIAHITDTQFLAEGAVSEDPEVAQRFGQVYRDQVEWIVDNAEDRKIAYTGHTGDIIENYMNLNHSAEHARKEFGFASQMQQILDDGGVPNGILPGNHDNKWGREDNSLYNEFFGPERYEALSETWDNAEYGGPWAEGDNAAHYDLFSAAGQDFVAVHLPYGHSREMRQWASEIFQSFPDRDGLLFTHAYLQASNNDDGSISGIAPYGFHGFLGGEGFYIRDEVVEPNENVVMVLSGHYHGTAWNVNHNGPGAPSFEMLADYQNYEVDGERRTGFMRLLQFDVDDSEVTINTYSPTLDSFDAPSYDTSIPRNYIPESDQYTVPISLSARSTMLRTDEVRVGEADESESQAPVRVDPISDVHGTVNEPIEDVQVVTHNAETVTISGLPSGLSYDGETGVISGTPTEAGTFTATVTATGEAGEDTQSVRFVIEPEPENLQVSIAEIADQTVTVNEEIDPIAVSVEPADAELDVTVDGLPEGVSYNAETGAIEGTPTEEGSFEVSVRAQNESGDSADEITFTLTVEAAQEGPTDGPGDGESSDEPSEDQTEEPSEEPGRDTDGDDTDGDDTDTDDQAGSDKESGEDSGQDAGEDQAQDTEGDTSAEDPQATEDNEGTLAASGATITLGALGLAALSIGLGWVLMRHRRQVY